MLTTGLLYTLFPLPGNAPLPGDLGLLPSTFPPSFSFFLRFYLFLERGERWEKEREKNIMCKRNSNWLPLSHPQLGTQPATQACALTGNGTYDLSVRRLVLHALSYTSQGLSTSLSAPNVTYCHLTNTPRETAAWLHPHHCLTFTCC